LPGARPRICRSGTRRRSSTSATNSTREHDRRTDRSPPRVRKNRAHVRSRAPLAPLSGVGSTAKGPKPLHCFTAEGPSRAARPKPHRPTGPCTEHGQHRRCLWRSARGRKPPAGTVASRGFTGQGPAACAAGFALAGSVFRQIEFAAFRQARRGRYPNPIRSDTSRRETVAPPAGEAGHCQARLVSEPARYDPTTRAPAPAKGESSWAPGRPACARPPATALQHPPCGGRGSTAARHVSLARTHAGPGPHRPFFREEDRGPLHPRCLPSVNRQRPRARPKPSPAAIRTGRTHSVTGVSPQVVASLWKIRDAFVRPRWIHHP